MTEQKRTKRTPTELAADAAEKAAMYRKRAVLEERRELQRAGSLLEQSRAQLVAAGEDAADIRAQVVAAIQSLDALVSRLANGSGGAGT